MKKEAITENREREERRTDRVRWTASVIVMAAILFGGALLCLTHRSEEISVSERRKLAQFPALSWEAVMDGEWTGDFEDYSLDQFPFRDRLRGVKAWVQRNLMRQRDNNGIYLVGDEVSRIEYPMDEASILRAGKKFTELYESYLKGTDAKLYLSVVPDKNYFLAEANGYLSMDYDRLVELLRGSVPEEMTYIDLFPYLEIGDYYRTDTHWRQECLSEAVGALGAAMGFADRLTGEYEEKELSPFYGVFYGQSALALKPDTIRYLTGPVIEGCEVEHLQGLGANTVYDLEKFSGMDPYDIFLSGATPLVTITNPAGESGRELVIFRDSFGSSIAPLLIEAYAKVTLVDIRYIPSSMLGEYLQFDSQDVLFLYSTLVLNGSGTLR